ncbi:DUF726-domain-containing protein [Lepidopterella palustris CBS 459.81]|uniref:DUF726-domain-containing protein n=1 Tax=Lepidopterella palustris CBS 459.81 TaxID=1314670 RepID=A0A8E2EC32_9PEZI|nr:DUF726-domain-containing protein [Lepidopterella palustris CBS 459.81]
MFSKLGSWASNADSHLPTTKADNGASLTYILDTPALRTELALLVLLCTDAMRSDLTAAFDPLQTNSPSPSSVPSPTRSPTSPEENLISFYSPEDDAAAVEEKARGQREREISSAKMQGLRRAALTFFDKWRAGVMHRICDVLGVRGEIVRRAKAKRKADAEIAEKVKDRLDCDWTVGEDTKGTASKHNASENDVRSKRIPTRLSEFDEQKRVLILHCLLLILLSLEHYPAHSRVILLHLACSLQLGVDILADHEKSMAQGLLATAASHMDADESTKKKAADNLATRKWKVGLATVGGAVLIGVTGGLAAPLLAAGLGTVMGGLGLGATVISSYLGALAGSTVLVGTLFGAYGGKMTGKIMDQYAREVEDFRFIPVQMSHTPASQYPTEPADVVFDRDHNEQEQHRLRIAIGISGWLNSSTDVIKPWEVLSHSGIEPFALRWELDALLRLGTSLSDVVKSYAWEGAKVEIVRRTFLGALYAGMWPVFLLKVASVLDNPFSIAMARSDKAGKVLAHALISKVQGERPVSLVGYSLGARVIYSCLLELAEQNAFGLVESAILMGTPAASTGSAWRRIRTVVSSRVVNIYSTEDYILGFLYRTSKIQLSVAGLQEVKGVYGIQNVDVSSLVTGHDRYRYVVGTILNQIGFEDVDVQQAEAQVNALQEEAEREGMTREVAQTSKVENEEEQVPWKQTDDHGAHRPAPPRHASSSSNPVPEQQSTIAQHIKAPSPVSGAAEYESDDNDDLQYRRIVMVDLEDDEPPPFPKPGHITLRETLSVKDTGLLQSAQKVEVVDVGPDSDADSVTSDTLGELGGLTILEPVPELEPEMGMVQTGSSV